MHAEHPGAAPLTDHRILCPRTGRGAGRRQVRAGRNGRGRLLGFSHGRDYRTIRQGWRDTPIGVTVKAGAIGFDDAQTISQPLHRYDRDRLAGSRAAQPCARNLHGLRFIKPRSCPTLQGECFPSSATPGWPMPRRGSSTRSASQRRGSRADVTVGLPLYRQGWNQQG
jgi:hypothetical protein